MNRGLNINSSNSGFMPIADLGGQRLLGMQGSLTNWINTGSAAIPDTFVSSKPQDVKKKKITAADIIKFSTAALVLASSAVLLYKNNSKIKEFASKNFNDFLSRFKKPSVVENVAENINSNNATKTTNNIPLLNGRKIGDVILLPEASSQKVADVSQETAQKAQNKAKKMAQKAQKMNTCVPSDGSVIQLGASQRQLLPEQTFTSAIKPVDERIVLNEPIRPQIVIEDVVSQNQSKVSNEILLLPEKTYTSTLNEVDDIVPLDVAKKVDNATTSIIDKAESAATSEIAKQTDVADMLTASKKTNVVDLPDQAVVSEKVNASDLSNPVAEPSIIKNFDTADSAKNIEVLTDETLTTEANLPSNMPSIKIPDEALPEISDKTKIIQELIAGRIQDFPKDMELDDLFVGPFADKLPYLPKLSEESAQKYHEYVIKKASDLKQALSNRAVIKHSNDDVELVLDLETAKRFYALNFEKNLSSDEILNIFNLKQIPTGKKLTISCVADNTKMSDFAYGKTKVRQMAQIAFNDKGALECTDLSLSKSSVKTITESPKSMTKVTVDAPQAPIQEAPKKAQQQVIKFIDPDTGEIYPVRVNMSKQHTLQEKIDMLLDDFIKENPDEEVFMSRYLDRLQVWPIDRTAIPDKLYRKIVQESTNWSRSKDYLIKSQGEYFDIVIDSKKYDAVRKLGLADSEPDANLFLSMFNLDKLRTVGRKYRFHYISDPKTTMHEVDLYGLKGRTKPIKGIRITENGAKYENKTTLGELFNGMLIK